MEQSVRGRVDCYGEIKLKKICVDLGATNVKCALVDNYKLLKTAVVPTDTLNGLDGVTRSIKAAIDKFIGSGETEICISSAGVIDVSSKTVIYATDNLPGYTGFDIGKWVYDNYKLPCVAINDGHAALLGELALNKEYRVKRVVMLTFGSGVGGSYAVNGKIIDTEENNHALFGHIVIEQNGIPCNCGNRGCAEQYLSGRAINKAALSAGIAHNKVFDEYFAGNAAAITVVDGIRKNLSVLLQKINAVCPFDICILGGGVIDGVGDRFDKVFSGLNYKIVKAAAGNYAGVLGAYYLADGNV